MKQTWQIPRMWDGEDVWILGGGPSVVDYFNIPIDVVTDVRFKRKGLEAYSPYLAPLHNKRVIGINVAYKIGSWIDICFFGDRDFYLDHRYELVKFKKLIVTCAEIVRELNVPHIKYLEQEKQRRVAGTARVLGISSRNNAVRWNYNSGAAAISLAAWLGAKRIILVGFDMTFNEKGNQHFHNEYKAKVVKKNLRRKPISPFKTHLMGFPYIKEDADKMGIEIINTSLGSAIKDFPKVDINELL